MCLKKGQTYTAFMLTSHFPSANEVVLRVHGADGSEVAASPNSSNGRAQLFFKAPSDGIYYLEADSYEGGLQGAPGGAYELAIHEDEGPNERSMAKRIAVGRPLNQSQGEMRRRMG